MVNWLNLASMHRMRGRFASPLGKCWRKKGWEWLRGYCRGMLWLPLSTSCNKSIYENSGERSYTVRSADLRPRVTISLKRLSMAHPLRSPTDGFPTPTSILQSTTEETLAGIPSSNTPTLQKKDHIQFLLRNLVQGFPSRYMSQDASQPWLMFWTVQGFSVFQVGLDPKNKQR